MVVLCSPLSTAFPALFTRRPPHHGCQLRGAGAAPAPAGNPWGGAWPPPPPIAARGGADARGRLHFAGHRPCCAAVGPVCRPSRTCPPGLRPSPSAAPQRETVRLDLHRDPQLRFVKPLGASPHSERGEAQHSVCGAGRFCCVPSRPAGARPALSPLGSAPCGPRRGRCRRRVRRGRHFVPERWRLLFFLGSAGAGLAGRGGRWAGPRAESWAPIGGG